MEIDFLCIKNHKVCPLEVKSPDSHSIRSLLKFKEKFGNKTLPGIVIHDGDYKTENGIEFVPIFALDWCL